MQTTTQLEAADALAIEMLHSSLSPDAALSAAAPTTAPEAPAAFAAAPAAAPLPDALPPPPVFSAAERTRALLNVRGEMRCCPPQEGCSRCAQTGSPPQDPQLHLPFKSWAVCLAPPGQRDAPPPATRSEMHKFMESIFLGRPSDGAAYAPRFCGHGNPHGARVLGAFAQPDGLCGLHYEVAMRVEMKLRGVSMRALGLANRRHPEVLMAVAAMAIDAGVGRASWKSGREKGSTADSPPPRRLTPAQAQENAIDAFLLHVRARVAANAALVNIAVLLEGGWAAAAAYTSSKRPLALAWLRGITRVLQDLTRVANSMSIRAFDSGSDDEGSAAAAAALPPHSGPPEPCPRLRLSTALLAGLNGALDTVAAAATAAKATAAAGAQRREKKAARMAAASGCGGGGGGSSAGGGGGGSVGGTHCVLSDGEGAASDSEGYGCVILRGKRSRGHPRESGEPDALPEGIGKPLAKALAGMLFMERGERKGAFVPECENVWDYELYKSMPWRSVRFRLARLGWGYSALQCVSVCVCVSPPEVHFL